MRAWVLLGASVVSLLGERAGADAIPPDWEPPTCEALNCPAGAISASLSHLGCGMACVPTEVCTTDSECTATHGEGARCVATRFCIGTTYEGNSSAQTVFGECSVEGACPTTGATETERPSCSEARRCQVPPRAAFPARARPAPAPESESSDGCTAAGSGAAVGWVWIAMWAARRRR